MEVIVGSGHVLQNKHIIKSIMIETDQWNYRTMSSKLLRSNCSVTLFLDAY